ncbi:MAG: hypothetical protein RR280_05210 [Bacteroidaceae bacterium]
MKTISHDRLWHSDFMSLGLVNLLITTSLFLLIPLFPNWVVDGKLGNTFSYAAAGATFAIGLFLPGPFNSYLVDFYKRKTVCVIAIIAVLLITFLLNFVADLALISFLRLLQGAAFSVAQMSLGSTLVNDLSMSHHRTKADYYYAWFGRFGLPLGMFLGMFVLEHWGLMVAWVLSLGMGGVALLLLSRIYVPFRAPLNTSLFSLDRFFQPQSFFLFLNFWPIAILAGLLIGEFYSCQSYALIMAGFAVALFSQRALFVDADLRSEIVSGLLLLGASILLLATNPVQRVQYLAFPIGGIGLGWVSSRFLLYFLKLSGHCQRGTLQNTYMLCWESGISIGFLLSFFFEDKSLFCLALILIALFLYLVVTHRWFMQHKDRDFKFREI